MAKTLPSGPSGVPNSVPDPAKGGRARSNALTPEHRREIARDAVRARWMKAGKLKQLKAADEGDTLAVQPVVATPVRPFSMFRGSVPLGPEQYECHVLSDFRRVFTQREMVRAISGGRESGNLQRYLDRNPLTAGPDFSLRQIEFDVPGAPTVAVGYEATQLIELCDQYMEAESRNLLKKSQKKLAQQAAAIMRASAKLGIIALIDEATGFQEARKKNDLRIKFQAFIADELQEWARMFPEEFWLELARLEGIRYSPRSRPIRWGKYIMAFVYDAVDGDVGRELREKNPDPRFKRNHHQWLKEFGRQKVNDQVQRVIAVMKLCTDMADFREKFASVFKKSPMQLGFADINWTAGPTQGQA